MNAPFIIYPAIDLHAGQVVRLRQGELAQQTHYSSDPGAIARQWQAAGASWLHVVNLDGAFGSGDTANQAALAAILAARGALRIQFGGGLRSLAAIEAILSLGIDRAILGTSAVEQPELVAEAVRRFGKDHIGVGIDAKNQVVRTHGWVGASGRTALDLGQQMVALGVETVVFTNIQRDGAGTGTDLAATQALAAATGLQVIASGGTASLADVQAARAAGLAGIIIGKALYDGQIALADALHYEQR